MKFSQNIFKNKSKRKRNFIIYHFLVEIKPHKKIDLLITASVNIYQTKKGIPIIMKTFLKEKWSNMEPFKENPPFSTNPLSLSNFFITPLLVWISKTRTPPPNSRGRKLRGIKFPRGGWITVFAFWFWKADVARYVIESV